MRRHIIYIMRLWMAAVAVAMGCATRANAQAGLDSLAMRMLFQNDARVTKTSETHIEGEQLASRGMTVFRCVNYTASDAVQANIAECMERDARRAASKELQRKNGRLSFALLQYRKPHSNQKSYLIFHRKDSRQCVCVYIEGTVSVTQIKEMFYK